MTIQKLTDILSSTLYLKIEIGLSTAFMVRCIKPGFKFTEAMLFS